MKNTNITEVVWVRVEGLSSLAHMALFNVAPLVACDIPLKFFFFTDVASSFLQEGMLLIYLLRP